MSTSTTRPSQPLSRPAFPPLQSSISTETPSRQSFSSTMSASSTTSAPLPSPSTSCPQQQGFFGSLSQHQSQQRQQQQGQPQQSQSTHYVHPSQYHYQPDRQNAGQTAAETNSYLSQAALLAEAAKRAQMAVVMRDIEGMEL
ncbi:uncharacterized protein EI97DRAFT_219677 [Westerdykella ornata]|uniref:Uncharacterized protein n=1 Tax=Westerdykella ornata TaxID=318751 RepID=A0A6A6JRA2_WESOR|nr:uncharacterized protein EI97DRAFT_219677 [Westerdykella ornata]KAF2278795.1 hypothetical protein EI97DRAFT_219677 [Westerdykella ornata]